jgi:hypothetical protein
MNHVPLFLLCADAGSASMEHARPHPQTRPYELFADFPRAGCVRSTGKRRPGDDRRDRIEELHLLDVDAVLKSEGEKWVLGFWSGLNYVASVTKDQNQLIIDPDKMLAEIEKMCTQRPSQSLADTVWITFLTLNKQ